MYNDQLNNIMHILESENEVPYNTISGQHREPDYAPTNEPIEGDDKLFNDLPPELQPDYVPQGYMQNSPEDEGCGGSCKEEFTSNFDF